jgi:30S ribosomal protein 3
VAAKGSVQQQASLRVAPPATTRGLRFAAQQPSRQQERLSLQLCRAEADAAAEAPTEIVDDWAEQYEGEGMDDSVPPPEFKLRFLWLPKNVAVAVDQVFGQTKTRSPLTEFYFWPRKDAWEELKASLESKNWISERDTVLMLNTTTEVINFWQEEGEKHTIEEAREKFPDCEFLGA